MPATSFSRTALDGKLMSINRAIERVAGYTRPRRSGLTLPISSFPNITIWRKGCSIPRSPAKFLSVMSLRSWRRIKAASC